MISSRRVVSRGPANPRPVLRSMSPCLLRDLAHRANQTCEIQFKRNPRTAFGQRQLDRLPAVIRHL
ncbi:hypothetical protein BFJ69_g7548 [Fusarium oxysporum]|uniref:Uncharacterized protein n=1 Tax=Fusarium oxysporum TaxID=5507 RepID=A0A420N641_FUSOX|nr:hypothetical protein BFJ69_g7548 [Fusarium oxysporum]